MRKAWSLALTPVVALAVSAALTTPAHAFGAEVLGCSVNGAAWTANACSGDSAGGTTASMIEFAVHNLSGTYTYAWTPAATTDCSSTTFKPCIYRGCTATASICDIEVGGGGLHDKYYTTSVKLTQSGLSRTLTATATMYANPDCLYC
jgi:hypothetical protein